MSEQRLLFDLGESPWIDRIWQRIPQGKQKRIVAILAEMGRSTVMPTTLPGKGKRNEP